MAANSLSVEAKLDDQGVVSGARQMRDALEDTEAKARRASDGFTVMKGILANLATQGIGMAASAVKGFCADIVEIGQTFETSMSKVSALSGATGEDLAALEAKARELGASTTYSASEAADALGYMALAGWDTADMLEGVGSVLTLAQAGEMDLAAASDLVTDYLSAFNMTAEDTSRMVDVLAYAQSNANTTVEGLGDAFKNCAANCNAAGLDIETTSSLIAQMANQGLKGQLAGTALSAVMRDMTAQMKDGAIAIGDASVAVMDAEGNYRDFIGILADVEAATDGMGDAEKAAALQSTFTADSIKGLNLLLNAGADEASAFRDELYGCAGTAQETADAMTDNLGGDLAAMNSALEETALKIYEGLQEPLRTATQFATSTAIPALGALVENLDKIAPVLAGIGLGLAAVASKQQVIGAAQKAHKALSEAVKASGAVHSTYFRAVGNGTTQILKWNATTKTCEGVQRTLRTTIASSTAGIKAQEAAMKAHAVATKAAAVASRALSTALKAIAPVAAITALVEVASLVSDALSSAEEHAKAMSAATDGMRSAMGAAKSAYEAYSPAAEGAAASNAAVAKSAEECIAATGELAQRMSDTWADVGTNAAMVDRYVATIEELAGKGELSATEQERLKAAVEGYNQVTGDSVRVTNAISGELSKSVGAIREAAEAYKEEARAQAARNMIAENSKQLLENEMALKEAQQQLAQAQADYDAQLEASGGRWMVYGGHIAEAQKKVDEITQAIGAQNQTQQQLYDVLSGADEPFGSFEEALGSVGASMEGFGQVGDAELAALESSFDGTLQSIVQGCVDNGIQIPSSLAQGIMSNSAAPKDAQQAVLDAMVLNMTGGDTARAAEILGHDIDQGLVNGITGSASLPTEAIGIMSSEVIARAKSEFDSNSPSLVMEQLGSDADAGLMNGIMRDSSGPVGAMGAMAQSAISALSGLPGQASGVGTSAGSSLASGLSASGKGAYGAAASLSTSAQSGIRDASAAFAAAGSTAANAYADAIGAADAYHKARALATTAENGLKAASQAARSAGDDFGQGYGLGIEGQSSFVYQRAYSLAMQAVKAVKDAQQSASPSKVARSLGGDYGQGYGLGIADEYRTASRAGAGLARSASEGAGSIAVPVASINWYADAGRYAGRQALGLGPEPSGKADRRAASEQDAVAGLLEELLEEVRALRQELPRMMRDHSARAIEVDGRELMMVMEDLEVLR